MKLGKLGFTGNSIKNRTESLGIYRPETNANIQSYNGELDNYTYSGKFLNLSTQIGGFEHITCMVMSPDGTKLYLIKNGTSFDGTAFGASTGTKTIYQIDLSEPWNITTGTYNNKFLELPVSNFFATTSNRNPQVMGIAFRPDGSKFYILTRKYTNTSSNITYSERKVFQYSTAISENAWDITTYTYDSVFLNMGSTGEIDGRLTASTTYTISADTDLYFNSEGTEMFIICDGRYPSFSQGTSSTINNDAIQKWTLDTGWDIQNAYLNDPQYSIPVGNDGISFNSDYSKVYIASNSDSIIWQYDLVTSGTFKNGTQNGQSKNVFPYCNLPRSVLFVDSSKPLYFCSDNGYIFSSGFNENLNITENNGIVAQVSDAINFKFNNDGTKLYILNSVPNKIVEYDVSSAYSITGLSATGSSLTFNADTSITSFHFNSNGSRLYTSRSYSSSQSIIEQYNLSVNYDLSTATYIRGYSLYTIRQDDPNSTTFDDQLLNPRDLYFKSDGSKLFILTSGGSSTDPTYHKVHQINLSSSWSFIEPPSHNFTNSSVSVQNTTSAGGVNASATTDNKKGLTFSSDGTYFYILEENLSSSSYRVYQYLCSAQWEISNATLLTGRNIFSDAPPILVTSLGGVAFSSDGEYMYISANQSSLPRWHFYTYKLSSGGTRWNPNSYVYEDVTVDASGPTYNAFKFKPDGSRVYFLSTNDSIITSYNYNVPWDPNGFTFTGNAQSPEIPISGGIESFYFRNDGLRIYFMTPISIIYEFELNVAWDITQIDVGQYNVLTTYNCVDLFINSDDSYLFTGQVNSSTSSNNIIVRHTLKTGATFPYNIANYNSSGTFTNVYGSDTTSNNLVSFYFKPDGSKIYALTKLPGTGGSSSERNVREWSLNTNWDLSTRSATYKLTLDLSLRLDVNIANLKGLSLSNGSSIITLNNISNSSSIRSYPLDTSWDVNSLTIYSSLLDIYSSTTSIVNDLFFDSTQQNLYFIDGYQIFHFKLRSGGTVGRISDYEYFHKINKSSWNIPTSSGLRSIFFKPDGSRVYLTYQDSNSPYFGLFQINLNNNWDLNSGNLSTIKIINPYLRSASYSSSTVPQFLLFNSTGTKIYFGLSSTVYEFDLKVAWDIGSGIKGIFDVSTRLRQDDRQVIIDDRPNSIFINSNKNKLYFTGSSVASTLYKRDISSYASIKSIEPFENGKFLYVGYYSGFLGGTESNNATIGGFAFGKGDGFDTFYVVGSDNKIYQFEIIKS